MSKLNLIILKFTKGLDKDDQKEELLKRLENIEDKNEKQLQLFSKTNRITRIAKNESDYNYDNKFAFYKFYRDFEINTGLNTVT